MKNKISFAELKNEYFKNNPGKKMIGSLWMPPLERIYKILNLPFGFNNKSKKRYSRPMIVLNSDSVFCEVIFITSKKNKFKIFLNECEDQGGKKWRDPSYIYDRSSSKSFCYRLSLVDFKSFNGKRGCCNNLLSQIFKYKQAKLDKIIKKGW